MREVVLKLTTQKDLVKHQSAAMTFGELKKEMKQIKWSGMRVVERSTKATLQMDDAVLPQGSFVLFLVPEKVKSGRKTEGGLEKIDVAEANYNELRSHMSWLNREKGCSLNMSGSTEDLRRRLKDYYRRQKGKKPAAKPAAKKPAAKKATPKPAAKKPAPKPAPKPEKKKEKKKKSIFGKKKKAVKAVDPLTTIEDARQMINLAVDELVAASIQGKTGGTPEVLEFTAAELEKEAKEIHRKLRTSRSSAKYID